MARGVASEWMVALEEWRGRKEWLSKMVIPTPLKGFGHILMAQDGQKIPRPLPGTVSLTLAQMTPRAPGFPHFYRLTALGL